MRGLPRNKAGEKRERRSSQWFVPLVLFGVLMRSYRLIGFSSTRVLRGESNCRIVLNFFPFIFMLKRFFRIFLAKFFGTLGKKNSSVNLTNFPLFCLFWKISQKICSGILNPRGLVGHIGSPRTSITYISQLHEFSQQNFPIF